MFQSNVDADGRIDALGDGDFSQVTGENQIPLVAFQFDGSGFNCPLELSVQFNLNHADILNPKFVPVQSDTVAVGGKLNALESAFAFESRETRFGITGFDAAFAAVQARGLIGDAEISTELMHRIRENNYIPPAVADEYAVAVLAEYKRTVTK